MENDNKGKIIELDDCRHPLNLNSIHMDHSEELKTLAEKSEQLRHDAYNIKVKLVFNEKRIKLIKEEIEALKPKTEK